MWRSPNCGERLAVEQRTRRYRVGETEGKRKRERLIETWREKRDGIWAGKSARKRERESAGEREKGMRRE